GLAATAWSSEGVNEVLKLQEAGVSQDVMLAYVQHSTAQYNLSADEIQRLEDSGVPATVIVAMIDPGNPAGAPADPTTAVTTDTPAPIEASTTTESEVLAPAADEQNVSYFYDSLSPYGTWVNDSEYGWAWSPRVETGWQPYVDGGHWVWTDSGWYWE